MVSDNKSFYGKYVVIVISVLSYVGFTGDNARIGGGALCAIVPFLLFSAGEISGDELVQSEARFWRHLILGVLGIAIGFAVVFASADHDALKNSQAARAVVLGVLGASLVEYGIRRFQDRTSEPSKGLWDELIVKTASDAGMVLVQLLLLVIGAGIMFLVGWLFTSITK